jgi:DNA-binding transcriptional LysR family regulator
MSNQIEFRHLRYFTAIANYLNFHRAAESLHISQPGLSRQIAQLEFHLGTQLLIRDRKSVSLTPAGQFLKQQLIPQLNRLNMIYEETRQIGAGKSGEIRIGFLGSAIQKVIPDLLLAMKTSHPELRASLEERSNQDQVTALLEERMDLGFVRLSELPNELESCTVVRETFSLVLPKQHCITAGSFESVAQLSDQEFILFSPEYSPDYYRTVLSICEDAGFHPRVSHKSVHAQTIFRLVAAGLGVAIVPTSLQQGFNLEIKFIELKNISQRAQLKAVWKRDHHNRALDACIDKIRALAKPC